MSPTPSLENVIYGRPVSALRGSWIITVRQRVRTINIRFRTRTQMVRGRHVRYKHFVKQPLCHALFEFHDSNNIIIHRRRERGCKLKTFSMLSSLSSSSSSLEINARRAVRTVHAQRTPRFLYTLVQMWIYKSTLSGTLLALSWR